MEEHTDQSWACPDAVSPELQGEFPTLLSREWLLTNGVGGYASSSVIMCHTRRYHGLLVAANPQPAERYVTLSQVLPTLNVGGRTYELANFEFNDVVHPKGFRYLTTFQQADAETADAAWWVYTMESVTFVYSIWLFKQHNLAYLHWIGMDPDQSLPLHLTIRPMIVNRGYHRLRRRSAAPAFDTKVSQNRVIIRDTFRKAPALTLVAANLDASAHGAFTLAEDWWHNFRLREEESRGQDWGEDQYMPGYFEAKGRGQVAMGLWVDADQLSLDDYGHLGHQLRGFVNHKEGPVTLLTETDPQHTHDPGRIMFSWPTEQRELYTQRLGKAADAFVVDRSSLDGRKLRTILAGYHWFADWGRDAMIALPGLLLETGRLDDAGDVLETFAAVQKDGLIPNRFHDEDDGCDYNSIDASLWFVYVVDQYLRADGDTKRFDRYFAQACANVVEAFINGTSFETHMDPSDGLITAGTPDTQVTWMDAKCGNVVFTPRNGKCVELNALWYNALRIVASRVATAQPALAKRCGELAEQVQRTFPEAFWNTEAECLYDCIGPDGPDASIRPNQIFAASLEYSPLPANMQMAVVRCVQKHLLTPVGLRSLSPDDPEYRGHYVGSAFDRDAAYHRGTVWAWLIGAFIEAHLKVNQRRPWAIDKARQWLQPLLDQLDQAGLGSINEIFDGDEPHTPRGCVAQAWSVAEVLRAFNCIDRAAGAAITDNQPATSPGT